MQDIKTELIYEYLEKDIPILDYYISLSQSRENIFLNIFFPVLEKKFKFLLYG